MPFLIRLFSPTRIEVSKSSCIVWNSLWSSAPSEYLTVVNLLVFSLMIKKESVSKHQQKMQNLRIESWQNLRPDWQSRTAGPNRQHEQEETLTGKGYTIADIVQCASSESGVMVSYTSDIIIKLEVHWWKVIERNWTDYWVSVCGFVSSLVHRSIIWTSHSRNPEHDPISLWCTY